MALNLSSDVLSYVGKFLTVRDVETLQSINGFPLKSIIPQIKHFNADRLRLYEHYYPLIRSITCDNNSFRFKNIIHHATRLNDVSLSFRCLDDVSIPNVKKLTIKCSIEKRDEDFKGLSKCEYLEIQQCRRVTLAAIKHMPSLKTLKSSSMRGIDDKQLKEYCEKAGISLLITSDFSMTFDEDPDPDTSDDEDNY